jgi:uncharacterized protein YbjQ (UPF0145 family)
MSALGEAPDGAAPPVDLRAEVLRAARALAEPAPGKGARSYPVTSDLSIDEGLLLHSIGWEPVELVYGVGVASVPVGAWTWGQGEVAAASAAYHLALRGAAARIEHECGRAHGHGVVGVRVDVEVHPHHVEVDLVGTAVRKVGGSFPGAPFISDLGARDFVLLDQAGWRPVGLAYGASFVYAPRRTAVTALRQSSQNVELTNLTQAMYAAREAAMERMQRSALDLEGTGVVAVSVDEGPMTFARHAIGFMAWGTAVRLEADAHRPVRPRAVVELNDVTVAFQAQALRGKG